MEIRNDAFASAKSHFFNTSSWGSFCDVTLTLKQARQSDAGGWIKLDDYPCRRAFRHFMNLLNRGVYGAAFRRHRKRLRVLPVLEKGERCWTKVEWGYKRILVRDGANAGWIDYMLKGRQKSEFDRL